MDRHPACRAASCRPCAKGARNARIRLFLPLAFASMLALGACGNNSLLEKLQGTWRCDVMATMTLLGLSGDAEEKTLAATTLAFDIKARRLVMDTGDVHKEHAFVLESENNESVVLRLDNGTALTLRFRGNDIIALNLDIEPGKLMQFSKLH